MANIKDIIKKMKDGMDKLRDVEDAKVKEVLAEFDTYVTSLDLEEVKEETKEDKKEVKKETETEAKIEEKKEEVKVEEKKEEVKKEDTPKSELSDAKSDSEAILLSLEVSKKLKEAALELQKSQEMISAKEEVINVYKGKITELEASLKVYTDRDQLELQQIYDAKIHKLIELYKNLGMEKNFVELQNQFSNDQIDKLIIDLSEINNVKVERKIVRETKLSQELELSSSSKKDSMSDANERAKLLWDFE